MGKERMSINKYLPSKRRAIATFASGMGFVILLIFTAFVIGFAAHVTWMMIIDGWRFYSR